MLLKRKQKSEEKTQSRRFFRKQFWITLLSVREQSAKTKKENQFSQYFFIGCRELVAWKTYFECFGKKYKLGTQVWWEDLKTVLQKNFPMESSFLEKNFWRTLLSVGVQKPEDRKKMFLGPFLTENHFQKWKFFFEKFGFTYPRGTQDLEKQLKCFFWENQFFWKTFLMNNYFWTI